MSMKPEYLKMLAEIKEDIQKSRKTYVGTVEGIVGSRIGFVKIPENRQSFVIAPLEMDKVLPGDKVKILVKTENNEEKVTVEELLETSLTHFTGEFTEDETGSYVTPDVYGLNKKIRIPKSYTLKAKKGDFIYVEIIDHPFKNKKPKAKVLEIIGSISDDAIEVKYTCYKNKISETFTDAALAEVTIFDESFIAEKAKDRRDMKHLNFVTIDSESTNDVDDAICVEYNDNQWKLYVAIADATEFLIEGSNLDKEAKKRTSSMYFLGKNIPMLPTELSSDMCSLQEGKDRLAIICEMDFNENADLMKYSFYEAVINSKAKLSYNEVEDYVQGDNSFAEKYGSLSKVIQNLYILHNLLKKNREINNLLQEYGDDFRIILDPHKKIKDIQKLEIKTSQRMVEECMVITNIAAANFLTNNYEEGVYRVHDGLKDNKVLEVKELLAKHYPDFDASLLFSLDGFKKVMETLSKNEKGQRIKKIILNNMKKSHFNKKQLGHFCMGFEEYTYFTSPIRRYVDVIVHRLIKSVLKGEKYQNFFDIDEVNKNISNISRSSKEVEDWLKSQYIENNFRNKRFKATVMSIEDSAIKLKLVENGIDGTYLLTKTIRSAEGFNLNKQEQILLLKEKEINILQTIEVEYDKFDFINKRLLFKNITA